MKEGCIIRIDGTFQTAISGAEQIITVHIFSEIDEPNKVQACLLRGSAQINLMLMPPMQAYAIGYALVTSRTAQTYQSVIGSLLNLFEKEHRILPAIAISDFEKAMLKALKALFPRAEVLGCHFHFRQALYRYFRKKKLYPFSR